MVLGDFFVQSLGKNYGSAHELLRTRMRSTTTVKDVQAQWQSLNVLMAAFVTGGAQGAERALRFPLTSNSMSP